MTYHNTIRLILLCLVINTGTLIIPASTAFGQRIKADVTVNLEQLVPEQQFELQNVHNIIKQYFEFSSWPEGKYDYEISLKIQIVIDRMQSSFEDVYHGRLFIASDETGFKEVDRRWRFPYQQNQPLSLNLNLFDGLTGLLNFYTLIVIGEYMDRLEHFAGDSFFRQARNIALFGRADRYNFWWDKREEFIAGYLNESHKVFRAMTAFYDAALYWKSVNNEEEKLYAMQEAIKLLEETAKIPAEEKFLKNFFDKEYSQLSALFATNSNILDILAKLDPNRQNTYLKQDK